MTARLVTVEQAENVLILSTEALYSDLRAAGKNLTMRRIPDASRSLLPAGGASDFNQLGTRSSESSNPRHARRAIESYKSMRTLVDTLDFIARPTLDGGSSRIPDNLARNAPPEFGKPSSQSLGRLDRSFKRRCFGE